MSTLEVKIPDLLLKQVNEVAMKEKVSVDQIVSIALAAQVSASQTRESISSRAKRVDWQKLDDILARVPAQPPLLGDEVDSNKLFSFHHAKPKVDMQGTDLHQTTMSEADENVTPAQTISLLLRRVQDERERSIVAIAGLSEDCGGTVIGTGSIIRFGSDVFLLTAMHVVSKIKSKYEGIAFSNGHQKPYLRFHGTFSANRSLDIAIARIPEPQEATSDRVACPENSIANSAVYSEKDILFVYGFPGDDSRFSAIQNGIRSRPLIYGGKPAISTDPFFISSLHLGMSFDPFHVIGGDGVNVGLPRAFGLSGSPVWRIPWNNDVKTWVAKDVKIVGISVRFDEGDRCIIATRIEHVREFLHMSGDNVAISFS